jgi:HEPN domain-containing protein
VERSADWLDQALGNLAHARSDLELGYFDWACFSAHQAAEMAVTAVFQRSGAVAWGHSVADLLQELGERREVPDGLVEGAIALDKVYIGSRYPDAHRSGAPRHRYVAAEAEDTVEHADSIVQFCEGLLSTPDP